MSTLVIQNLTVEFEGRKVLEDLSLTVKPGEKHLLIGPNGAGKSTLALALLGHPKYLVTAGKVTFGGRSLLALDTAARAQLGILLLPQAAVEIPGVSLFQLLRAAELGQEKPSIMSIKQELRHHLTAVNMPEEAYERSVGAGSGGEKKRLAVAEFLTLAPKLAIMDEIDSGLDADGQRQIAEILNRSGCGLLVISHNAATEISFDRVHILAGGRIAVSGGAELLAQVGEDGYVQFGAH